MKTLAQALAEWRRCAESARGTRFWEHDETHILECSPERVLALLLVAVVALDVDIQDAEQNASMNTALAALARALDAEVRT